MKRRNAIVVRRVKNLLAPPTEPLEWEQIEISAWASEWGAVCFEPGTGSDTSNGMVLSPDEAIRIAIQLLEAARVAQVRGVERERELNEAAQDLALLSAEYAEREAVEAGKLMEIPAKAAAR